VARHGFSLKIEENFSRILIGFEEVEGSGTISIKYIE
jgi:hypothetical protein